MRVPFFERLLSGLLLTVLALGTGCSGLSAARRAELEAAAMPAYEALKAARFEDASAEAAKALAAEPTNSRAASIAALATYRLAARDLVSDALTIASSAVASGLMGSNLVNVDFLSFAAQRADKRLAEVDAHLAVAQADPGFSLDLCLACWSVDWNRSGEVDARDERLFEVERDANNAPYPADDPRRRPTFRFDVADTAWLRALVSFQRGVLALAEAFDPNVTWAARNADALKLELRDPKKLLAARDFVLQGLAHAEVCRALVLAETDDVREWLPSPKQKDHAIPLPVDEALYDTWAGVLADVRKLLSSEEGLSVAALAQLGDKKWVEPPPGFVDVGAFFTQPRDYVITDDDVRAVRRHKPGPASESLGRVLGPSYRANMPPSALLQRLERMRQEVDRGEEHLERKLRYLFWLN